MTDPYEDILEERHPCRAFRSNGFHNVLMDAAELGARVAYWLDSENNVPEVHFLNFDSPRAF